MQACWGRGRGRQERDAGMHDQPTSRGGAAPHRQRVTGSGPFAWLAPVRFSQTRPSTHGSDKSEEAPAFPRAQSNWQEEFPMEPPSASTFPRQGSRQGRCLARTDRRNMVPWLRPSGIQTRSMRNPPVPGTLTSSGKDREHRTTRPSIAGARNRPDLSRTPWPRYCAITLERLR